MTTRLPVRTNEAWLAALESDGAEDSAALEELGAYLTRILRKVLRDRPGVLESDLADLAQEAMARLIEYRHTFRGDSAFPTWATAVATRVAFTHLRKRSVRDRGRVEFDNVRSDALATPPEEDSVVKNELLKALHSAIDTELTDRQRVAILAELRGIPTIEIAEQLETNQNALYKLVHDGRKKLRSALVGAGFGADAIHEFVRGGAET